MRVKKQDLLVTLADLPFVTKDDYISLRKKFDSKPIFQNSAAITDHHVSYHGSISICLPFFQVIKDLKQSFKNSIPWKLAMPLKTSILWQI